MPYPIVALIAWRPEYKSMDEPFYAPGYEKKYGEDGKILVSHDCYNFLRSGHNSASRYYGYFPTKWDDNNDCNVNLNLSRIDKNIDQNADFAQCPIVYFVARNPGLDERDPQRGRLHLVGWYEDAKVYAQPKIYPQSYPRTGSETGVRVDELTYRTSARTATLLPDDMRPAISEVTEFGFKNIVWLPNFIYLDNNGSNPEGRTELRNHLENTRINWKNYSIPDIEETTIVETRKRRAHESLERRSNYRSYRNRLGQNCHTCGFNPGDMENSATQEGDINFIKIWGRSLEIHHRVPFSDLDPDARREIRVEDLVLLCARCHRAIHATDNPGDVEGFKTTYFR